MVGVVEQQEIVSRTSAMAPDLLDQGRIVPLVHDDDVGVGQDGSGIELVDVVEPAEQVWIGFEKAPE